jgi:hypothetical protein
MDLKEIWRWLHLTDPGLGPTADSCEHVNEPSNSTNNRNFWARAVFPIWTLLHELVKAFCRSLYLIKTLAPVFIPSVLKCVSSYSNGKRVCHFSALQRAQKLLSFLSKSRETMQSFTKIKELYSFMKERIIYRVKSSQLNPYSSFRNSFAFISYLIIDYGNGRVPGAKRGTSSLHFFLS